MRKREKKYIPEFVYPKIYTESCPKGWLQEVGLSQTQCSSLWSVIQHIFVRRYTEEKQQKLYRYSVIKSLEHGALSQPDSGTWFYLSYHG